MLPTINKATKRQLSPNYENSRHHSKKLLSDLALEEIKNGAFLPILSDSSLTSLVGRKFIRNQWDAQNMKPTVSKLKSRGGGFKDYTSQKTFDRSSTTYGSSSFPMIKTQDLQLRFQSTLNVNKGWSSQNPNPRLLKLQSDSGKLNDQITPFSFRNVDDYSVLRRTLAAPHVDYLYQRKHALLNEENVMSTDGSTLQLNDRFLLPVASAPERLPEIYPPPRQPLPHSTEPGSSLPSTDELTCVHKKSCSCVNIGDKETAPSRSMYNQWERKTRKTLHSSSSSSMTGLSKQTTKQQQLDKPLVSPPKLPQRKINREISLENLRRKVKKVTKQNPSSQENLDKKRRSSHSNIAKTLSSKKIKNRREPKPMPSTVNSPPKVDILEVAETDRQVTVNNEAIDNEVMDHDEAPNSSEPEANNDYINEELSIVETVSSVATPASLRRAATPRILKTKLNQDELETDDMSSLRKTFNKLDSDGDGHLSFDELKQSLPNNLTKRQLDYLKKIYLMACESTFFGFEEFVAVNQMCDVIAHASPPVLEAYESVDVSTIVDVINMYLKVSNYLDRKQTGLLDISSFKDLLASSFNVHKDSEVVSQVLETIGKTNTNDVTSWNELLVYIPYLESMKPS